MNETERKYHLSYDIIEKNDWEDGVKSIIDNKIYKDAKKFAISIIEHLGGYQLESPCESTILFRYKDKNVFNIQAFREYFSKNFYFYISLVALNTDDKPVECFKFNTTIDNDLKSAK